jgi:hypothetical protein
MTPEQLDALKVFADLTYDEQVEKYDQILKSVSEMVEA